MTQKSEIAFGQTLLGKAMYNVWMRHGGKDDWFNKVSKDKHLIAEIEREWFKLERKAKEKNKHD